MSEKLVAKMNLKVYSCNKIIATSTTIPTKPTTTSPNTLTVTFYYFIIPTNYINNCILRQQVSYPFNHYLTICMRTRCLQ